MPSTRQSNWPGYYSVKSDNETATKIRVQIGNKSILLVVYDSNRLIKIFVGGREKWCIHCELIRRNNTIQPMGYLIKVRYDMLCSLEHNFSRGHDIKQMMYFLLDYIHKTYATVKELQFNDSSTRQCDNDYVVNLAVMTYLYSGKTWYEKNYSAYISSQHSDDLKKIIQKYNDAKKIEWDEMSGTIKNTSLDNKINLEKLYNKSASWKEFFEPIYKKMEIGDFCGFISSWIDGFISKYFNNLGGLTYMIPIRKYDIDYILSDYTNQMGGANRRFTRKLTRRRSKDYG